VYIAQCFTKENGIFTRFYTIPRDPKPLRPNKPGVVDSDDLGFVEEDSDDVPWSESEPEVRSVPDPATI
jgi:hypothetical protein